MKIIGIDPDLRKSGYANFDTELKHFTQVTSLYLWDLFKEIKLQSGFSESIVYIEHSEKNCVWHGGRNTTSINVGKNKAISIILIDFCEKNGINYKTVEPSGYSILFDNIDIFQIQTDWLKKTNKDARAAAAIVFSKIKL